MLVWHVLHCSVYYGDPECTDTGTCSWKHTPRCLPEPSQYPTTLHCVDLIFTFAGLPGKKKGLLFWGWHTSRPEQLFCTGHLVSVAVTSSEKMGWVSIEPFPKGAAEMSVHVRLGYTSKMSGWRHRRSKGKPARRKEFDALHPHPLSWVALCLYARACVFTGTSIC